MSIPTPARTRSGAIFRIILASLLVPACSSAPNNEVVMISYAGALQIPHREFLARPFEEAHPGVRVRLVPSESEDVVAQIKAARGASPYDLIPLGEPRQIVAVQEQWIEQTPRESISNLKEVYPQFVEACADYGVPETYSLIGLAYHPEMVPRPQAWSDLWSPQYRGKIGLTTPASNLGFAFVVLVAKIFGGNENDLAPAWSKLQGLEPFVVAPNPTALAQLFERREIAVAPLWNNDAATLAGKGLPVRFVRPEPGAILMVSCMNVIRTSRHAEIGRRLLNEIISFEYQSRAAEAPFYFGPTNRRVDIPANAHEYLPATAEELTRLTISMRWDSASRHRGEVTSRFNREFRR